jgi:hypothetical protein
LLPKWLDGSRDSFAQQVLELGEDLLDWIEVGRIFPQKNSLAPRVRMSARTALPVWLPRLSMMTMSVNRHGPDTGQQAKALIYRAVTGSLLNAYSQPAT